MPGENTSRYTGPSPLKQRVHIPKDHPLAKKYNQKKKTVVIGEDMKPKAPSKLTFGNLIPNFFLNQGNDNEKSSTTNDQNDTSKSKSKSKTKQIAKKTKTHENTKHSNQHYHNNNPHYQQQSHKAAQLEIEKLRKQVNEQARKITELTRAAAANMNTSHTVPSAIKTTGRKRKLLRTDNVISSQTKKSVTRKLNLLDGASSETKNDNLEQGDDIAISEYGSEEITASSGACDTIASPTDTGISTVELLSNNGEKEDYSQPGDTILRRVRSAPVVTTRTSVQQQTVVSSRYPLRSSTTLSRKLRKTTITEVDTTNSDRKPSRSRKKLSAGAPGGKQRSGPTRNIGISQKKKKVIGTRSSVVTTSKKTKKTFLRRGAGTRRRSLLEEERKKDIERCRSAKKPSRIPQTRNSAMKKSARKVAKRTNATTSTATTKTRSSRS
eukprot:g1151.t1